MRERDERFMRMAITAAESGIQRMEYPFGCCIVSDEDTYISAGNHCLTSGDPTSHAEMNAIREWSRRYGFRSLGETVLYATSEPCLMCLGAINWARIPRIVYGASLGNCMDHGFAEVSIISEVLTAGFPYQVSLEGGVLERECGQLFTAWNRKKRLINLFSEPVDGQARRGRM